VALSSSPRTWTSPRLCIWLGRALPTERVTEPAEAYRCRAWLAPAADERGDRPCSTQKQNIRPRSYDGRLRLAGEKALTRPDRRHRNRHARYFAPDRPSCSPASAARASDRPVARCWASGRHPSAGASSCRLHGCWRRVARAVPARLPPPRWRSLSCRPPRRRRCSAPSGSS